MNELRKLVTRAVAGRAEMVIRCGSLETKIQTKKSIENNISSHYRGGEISGNQIKTHFN